MRKLLIFFLLSALTATSAVKSQEATRKDTPDGDYSAELPRIPATEPGEAIKKFTLAPGFRIELVASEPEVASPVAMAFDEAGRIYVVEMRDYSEQDKEHLGRIRLLQDKDGDGHYETARVFAEGLSWPTAILCYEGGVFVGAAPDLLFLKDTNGDGRVNAESSDEQRVIFTGFGRSNVQGLMNSFQWGPDNRVYVAVSSSGAQLKKPGAGEILLDLRGRDLAFDPRTLKCESIAGGAQHGMSFTKWGERLVCSNSDHLQWIAYDDSLAAKNPFLPAPPARVSIAADGPQAEVFRTSAVEPWRIVRTRLRTTGVVPGLVEGGGRASGYFTSATGVTAVTETAFPATDGEWIVVGDVGSNLVHRKKLIIENGMLRGVRVDEKSELLSSSDNWFRPVQFANGPDGALYILDMYREVIEHPASLPPAIKKHLDLTSGRDRGRIWRLTKSDFKREKPRDLGKLTTSELITCLGEENNWIRTTASRLLHERQKYLDDRTAILAALCASAESEGLSSIAMFHHLQILAAAREEQESSTDLIGRLKIAVVEKCLKSSDASLRLAASRICEKQMHLKLVPAILKLLNDDNGLIRRSAAFALCQIEPSVVTQPLVDLAKRDFADERTRYAIMLGFQKEPGVFSAALLRDDAFRAIPASRDWLRPLIAALKGLLNAPEKQKLVSSLQSDTGAYWSVEKVLSDEERKANIDAICEVLRELLPKGRQAASELIIALALKPGSNLAAKVSEATGGESESLIASYMQEVRAEAVNKKKPLMQRVNALGRLQSSTFAAEKSTLDEILVISEPADVQLAAIQLLGQFGDEQIAPWLLEKWPTMTPTVRDRSLTLLVSRTVWLDDLLKALDDKAISPVDMAPTARTALLQHPEEKVRSKARQWFIETTARDKERIMAVYLEHLDSGGDRAKGKSLFKQHCSACHQLEGVGNATGPNLVAMKSRGAAAILTNVIDPNREVLPQYLSYTVELADGRVLSGMIESESPTTIVLRKADGQQEPVQRVAIESLRSTGQSLMPEGLEKQLDQAAMADLLAYLMKAE